MWLLWLLILMLLLCVAQKQCQFDGAIEWHISFNCSVFDLLSIVENSIFLPRFRCHRPLSPTNGQVNQLANHVSKCSASLSSAVLRGGRNNGNTKVLAWVTIRRFFASSLSSYVGEVFPTFPSLKTLRRCAVWRQSPYDKLLWSSAGRSEAASVSRKADRPRGANRFRSVGATLRQTVD